MTIFRPFHNGTFQKMFCLQKSIVKLKAKDKKSFAMLFKIFSAISYTFSPSFCQRAGANSPSKNFDNDLNFVSFVYDFSIFAHFVEKNLINSNGKLSNCLKPMQSQT